LTQGGGIAATVVAVAAATAFSASSLRFEFAGKFFLAVETAADKFVESPTALTILPRHPLGHLSFSGCYQVPVGICRQHLAAVSRSGGYLASRHGLCRQE
jgi:hypothetical protein